MASRSNLVHLHQYTIPITIELQRHKML